jgi:two-component system nitrogen regulation response regulator GlnG
MNRVLIIDDEESICWGLAKLCEQMGLACKTAASAEAGLKLAAQESFQAVILDVRLPGMDGLTAIKKFHEVLGAVPVITITAFGDLQTAITSVQNGAFEYVVKPFDLAQVRKTLNQALAAWSLTHADEAADNHLDGTEVRNADSMALGLVGTSPIMQEVFKQIALTTTTDSSVLITGESGTGKELAARAIHRFSQRGSQPFVAVNIAALSPSLVESELFGHVKGAFTGADANRAGLIQQAAGGTLFLDEVAEIPLEIQVKLLRVLDLGEVTPVGSNVGVKANFRLISATHQDLLNQINHGEFRHDLFYRLRTFEIQLPSLRQHREDIPVLVRHFLGMVDRNSSPSHSIQPTPSAEFIAALQQRDWPGNVRELRSVVARAAMMARGGVLTPDHLEAPTLHSKSSPTGNDHDVGARLRELVTEWTKQHWSEDEEPLYEALLGVIDPAILSTAFELSGDQYSAASRRLGIHRTTLKKKLDEMS